MQKIVNESFDIFRFDERHGSKCFILK
jgi:hypothetical protein